MMTEHLDPEVEMLTAGASGWREVDRDTRGVGGADAEAAPRRHIDQGARARAPLKAADRDRAGQVHHRLSRAGGCHRRLCRLLPLTCHAPDVVEAIRDGRQPKGLKLTGMLGNGLQGWNSSVHDGTSPRLVA